MWIIILIGLIVSATVVSATVVSQIIKGDNTPWQKPLLDWMQWTRSGATTVWSYFSQLVTWINDSEVDHAMRDLRAIRSDEDRIYADRLSLIPNWDNERRKVLHEERRLQLEARAEQVRSMTGRSWGATVAFCLALLSLPPIFVASYFLKSQVATEFLVGSARLKGIEIPLWGDLYLELRMVQIASGGLIALEVLAGIIMAVGYEGIQNTQNGDSKESGPLYKVLFWFSVCFTILLVLLEGFLGLFRGSLEVGGETYGTVWLVIFSMMVPTMTVMISFVLKHTLQYVTGPIGKLFRCIGAFIGIVFTVPLFVVVLLFSLLVHSVLIPASTNSDCQSIVNIV